MIRLIARWGGLVLLVSAGALLGFTAGRATAPEPVQHACAPIASSSPGSTTVISGYLC